MEKSSTSSQWPWIMRFCWLGNGVVNNLQEPSAQLDEYNSKILLIEERFANGGLTAAEEKLLLAELERQLEFMGGFQAKLQNALGGIRSVIGRKHDAN